MEDFLFNNETIIEYFLIYLLAIILLIVLSKLKMKPWWTLVNLLAFTSYFSIANYEIINSESSTVEWTVRLLTIFITMIHIVFFVIVYFIAKDLRK